MSVDDDTSGVRDSQYVVDVNTAEMAVNKKNHKWSPLGDQKLDHITFPTMPTIPDTSGMLRISIIAL